MLGVAQLLPRFYRFLQAEEERQLARIILETGEAPETNGKPLTRSANGHDPARLRACRRSAGT